MSEHLSRREFLKISGASLAGVLVEAPESEQRYNPDVDYAFLTDKLMPFHLLADPSLITGEANLQDLQVYNSDLPALIDWYERGNDEAVIFGQLLHVFLPPTKWLAAIKDVKERDTQMVFNENIIPYTVSGENIIEYYKAYQVGQLKFLTASTVAMNLGILSIYATQYIRDRANKDQQERAADYEEEEKKKGKGHKLLDATQIAAMVILADQGLKHSGVVLEWLGAQSDEQKNIILNSAYIRNRNMAANLLLTKLSLAKNPDLRKTLKGQAENILFYAGTSHRLARNEIRKGLPVILEKLKGDANKKIADSEEAISNGIISEDPDTLGKFLDYWTITAGSFYYPIPTYATQSEYRDSKYLELPDAPRTILWKALLERFNQLPYKSNALELMIGRLLTDDLITQTSLRGFSIAGKSEAVPQIKEMRYRALGNKQAEVVPIPIRPVVSKLVSNWADIEDENFSLLISEGIPFIVRDEELV